MGGKHCLPVNRNALKFDQTQIQWFRVVDESDTALWGNNFGHIFPADGVVYVEKIRVMGGPARLATVAQAHMNDPGHNAHQTREPL
ncbi:hypothetical protein BANRA_05514 [Klebsiella pneumoniae]|nr:hypothetical protein BANRA_05514 [Klebsiella pneumoniae]